MILIQKHRQSELIKAIENLIMSISLSKFFWIDEDSGKTLNIFVSNTTPTHKVIVSGKYLIEGTKLQYEIKLMENASPIHGHIVISAGLAVIELPPLSIVEMLKFRHVEHMWVAWRFFSVNIQILDHNQELQKSWCALQSYESINGLINTLSVYIEDYSSIANLRALLDSVFFVKDWVKTDTVNEDLFNLVHKAISPYTVGSHGVTLALEGRVVPSMIEKMTEVLNSTELPWFCVSGTLLGIVRSGTMIPYDDDFDFAVYLGVADDLEQLKNIVSAADKVLSRIGTPVKDYPIWYKMKGDLGAIDIFLSWSNSAGDLWVWPWSSGSLRYNDIFPLATSKINGVAVFIPNNPVRALEFNYGDNWRTPDPLWRFDWDKANNDFRHQINHLNGLQING